MSLHKQFLKSKNAWKVTFSLADEAVGPAKEVVLMGDFNNWEKEKAIPMKNTKGNFSASMEMKPGEQHEFRYLIDNEIWVSDGEADRFSATPYGVENSVVVAPEAVEK